MTRSQDKVKGKPPCWACGGELSPQVDPGPDEKSYLHMDNYEQRGFAPHDGWPK